MARCRPIPNEPFWNGVTDRQGAVKIGSGSVRPSRPDGLEKGGLGAHHQSGCQMTASHALFSIGAVLFGFGILTIAVSEGFFMHLLGAGMMATGGTAAYLISSWFGIAAAQQPSPIESRAAVAFGKKELGVRPSTDRMWHT
jgi:hypothetical protein